MSTLLCPPCTALFISSHLKSEEQNVKYHTDTKFQRKYFALPRISGKDFQEADLYVTTGANVHHITVLRCTRLLLLQANMSGPGLPPKEPPHSWPITQRWRVETPFSGGRTARLGFQRRAVDCENTERPSDNGSIKVAFAVVRRQLHHDQGGSGWTMWIYTKKNILWCLELDETQLKDVPDETSEQKQQSERSQTLGITDKLFFSADCLLSVISELLFLFFFPLSVGARRWNTH